MEFHTYEELAPIAIKAMQDEKIDELKKFGIIYFKPVYRMFTSPKQVGRWLIKNGYVKKKMTRKGKQISIYTKL